VSRVERIFEAFDGKPGLLYEFLAYVEERTEGKLLSPWIAGKASDFYSFVRLNQDGDIVAAVVWADGDYNWMLDIRSWEGTKGPANKGSFHMPPSDQPFEYRMADLRQKAQGAADDRLREFGWLLA
jgi:hypothetical protein